LECNNVLTNTNDTLINYGNSILFNISFSGSLNSITATTFNYLSGVTSNIQSQLNYLFAAVNPVGSIIAHVGLTTTVSGYLYCDGSEYLKATYPTLYSVIGDQFGTISGNTPTNTNYFRVPNYKAVFLRGAGSNTVNGNLFSSQNIGIYISDTMRISTLSDSFVTSINVSKTDCLTNVTVPGVSVLLSKLSMVQNVTVNQTTIDIGNGNETCPVNSSVNYFIKY